MLQGCTTWFLRSAATAAAASEVPLVQNVAVPVTAPVVTTKTKTTLADHLDLRNLPIATTPGGRAFAIKTLHPADSEIKTVRGPGGLIPTTALAFDAIKTVPWPATAEYCRVTQWPHLWFPFCITFFDSGMAVVSNILIANSALASSLGNSTVTAITDSVLTYFDSDTGKIDSYRVLAQSVTMDFVAPAVADQGVITSSQYVDRPRTIQPTVGSVDSSGIPVTTGTLLAPDMWVYRYDAHPGTEQSLIMGTSAFTGNARGGFYQPLKIDKFKYVPLEDTFVYTDIAVSNAGFLYSGVPSFWGGYPINGGGANFGKKAMVKPSGCAVGVTWISGTAGNPQVALRFRFRQVTELIPVPGTNWGAISESPLPPDELSYKMVREIGAKMKDAYPASYNDLGKLKDTIMKIGKGLLKYADPALDILQLVPGAAPAVSTIRTGIDLGKQVAALAAPIIRKARQARKEKQAQQAKMQKLPAARSGLNIQRPAK